MHHLDLTNDDIAAAALAVTLWPDLFEDMPGSSNTLAPQGIHEGSMSAYPSTADAGLPNLNAGNETAFTPTPTTSMGTFTTHWQSRLPCHRTMLRLGPCCPKVCLVFVSAMTRLVYRIRSVPRYRFCCLPAAGRLKLVGGLSLCRQLSGTIS